MVYKFLCCGQTDNCTKELFILYFAIHYISFLQKYALPSIQFVSSFHTHCVLHKSVHSSISHKHFEMDNQCTYLEHSQAGGCPENFMTQQPRVGLHNQIQKLGTVEVIVPHFITSCPSLQVTRACPHVKAAFIQIFKYNHIH